MPSPKAVDLYRAGVAAFLLLILGAQAATLLVTARHGTFLRNRLYPIIEYPMYAVAHYENERVDASWLLEAVDQDGRTFEISYDQLHVDIFDWVNIMQAVLHGSGTNLDALRELVRKHIPGAGQFVELRIKSYPLQVTRGGPRSLPSQLLMTVSMQPGS
jgi:hypothetical protein